MTLINELLGIKYPLIQGAMAKISTSELVSAVSEAGGLGVIASGGMTTDQVRDEIRKTKQLTDKPFAVNVMLMMENRDEIIDVVIEEGVKIITSGAGTPKPYMKRLKENGVIVMPVVPNVKIALKMQELGADAVIVEGMEAGGHIGEVCTIPLVSAATQVLSIPVIAAGGLSDGRSLAAALALGAKGIQMGTVYLATEECPVSTPYKQEIMYGNETSTVVTGRNNGAPVRNIRNAMTTKYLELERQDVSRDELEELTIGSLYRAVKEGDMINGSVMAGQIIGTINEIKTVQQLHDDIIHQYRELILPKI
ncbi:2-nitropropane dioxygenase [Vagococcus martis]|uniref:Probable nitronate monooxygenase n=1 Tax=Vagococcus martis TaxID=1768210 RepID=A0A1V4DIW4_9ENTE|nr:nitronate monooxygenase [Vagococcus martis]OPF88514.1 2-nitropropane dioxygenase [Vagococcus martis]